jgi:hypothetical protein
MFCVKQNSRIWYKCANWAGDLGSFAIRARSGITAWLTPGTRLDGRGNRLSAFCTRLNEIADACPIVCEIQGHDIAQVIRHRRESKEMIVGIWQGRFVRLLEQGFPMGTLKSAAQSMTPEGKSVQAGSLSALAHGLLGGPPAIPGNSPARTRRHRLNRRCRPLPPQPVHIASARWIRPVSGHCVSREQSAGGLRPAGGFRPGSPSRAQAIRRRLGHLGLPGLHDPRGEWSDLDPAHRIGRQGQGNSIHAADIVLSAQ